MSLIEKLIERPGAFEIINKESLRELAKNPKLPNEAGAVVVRDFISPTTAERCAAEVIGSGMRPIGLLVERLVEATFQLCQATSINPGAGIGKAFVTCRPRVMPHRDHDVSNTALIMLRSPSTNGVRYFFGYDPGLVAEETTQTFDPSISPGGNQLLDEFETTRFTPLEVVLQAGDMILQGAHVMYDDSDTNWSLTHAVDVPGGDRITLGVFAKHTQEC